ncbi:MAG: trypsin-like peptidase domain-containing protein [Verrucomicrobiales bacterium]|jgi:hypothetical protein|nr:trypsin-like peptidase domain-containing protein [Verrucomicrobiales bacterium]
MKRIASVLAATTLLAVWLDAGQFGTGFAISPKGYLVTCHHVVRDAERIIIHVDGGYLEAKIVALDPRNDLAILKVEEWSGRYLGLTPSSEVTQTSGVLAAGFPDPTVLGINPKISTGIVNALSGIRDDPRFIQISAPVQPGNSGGPLVSTSGRVVGVVASGLNSMDRMTHGGYLPQSVNYAIKSDLIFPLLKAACVSVPKLGTRTSSGNKQVHRVIDSIALIEGLRHGERMYRDQPLFRPGQSGRPDGLTTPTSLRNNQEGHFVRNAPSVIPAANTRPLQIFESQTPPIEAFRGGRN